MHYKKDLGTKTFETINGILLVLLGIVTLYPFLYFLVLSFNDGMDAMKGGIYIWPRSFTLANYQKAFENADIINAFKISVTRTVIGTICSLLLNSMAAYGLSQKNLPGRTLITFYFFFTTIFSGGMAPSMSKLFGKTDFKRMRYPVHIILMALSMFYLGKNSFRNIALILRIANNIKVSHTTISNWCKQFAPLFHNISLELVPMLNFNSDEWHADETVVKILGIKHYIWFIVDSETRFVLGFHLSPYRNSPQAFTLFDSVKDLGNPNSLVTDRYSAYKVPAKSVLNVKHIRVESFKDDISNNLIECFNKQFKAWYKTKQGFNSYECANNLISMFVFFFNFVRPHSALSNLTPAQVAGLSLSKKEKQRFLLVA
jgi:putative transposase